jgi:hypothetical protein
LVQLQRQDVSAPVAAVQFTSGIDGTYEEYELRYYGVTVSATAALYLRTSPNNGTSWDAGTSYAFNYTFGQSTTPAASGGGLNNAAQIQISNSIDQVAVRVAAGVVNFWPRSVASGQSTYFLFRATTANNANGLLSCHGSGVNSANNQVTGIQILAASGNITGGTFILFGRVK